MMKFEKSRLQEEKPDNNSINIMRVSGTILAVRKLYEENPDETEFLIDEGLNEAEARKVWHAVGNGTQNLLTFVLRDGRTISGTKFLNEEYAKHEEERLKNIGLDKLGLDNDVAQLIATFIYECISEANQTGVYRNIPSEEVALRVINHSNLRYNKLLREKIIAVLSSVDTLDAITKLLSNQLSINQEKKKPESINL